MHNQELEIVTCLFRGLLMTYFMFLFVNLEILMIVISFHFNFERRIMGSKICPATRLKESKSLNNQKRKRAYVEKGVDFDAIEI